MPSALPPTAATSGAARSATTARGPKALLPTVVSGLGAALISFGLLGYVASGLQPAPHGSSILLFVPVDPIQNTVCVLLGFALSSLAARRVLSGRR